MSQRSKAELRILAGRAALLAPFVVLLSACDRGILDPVGPVGSAEKTILINSTAIMLAIIIPTMVATVAVAWWFRRGNDKAEYLPEWEYSGAIEMVVWGIPLLTIMLLGGITWISSHDLEPSKPLVSDKPPLKVEVVSLDWKWLFIYPDQGIATVNKLVVPANTPVSYRLTSATVWNVFFVPQFGTMIYTMPRMTTQLNLQADRQGVYDGLSAHFSGDGFPGMEFKAEVLPADQFAMWAQGAHGQGGALDAASFAELSKPTSYVKPITYGAVAPGLFDAVVANRVDQLHLPQAAPPSEPAPTASPGG
ncbi:ubiquinol oxidase subunit II [Sphingomonas sp. RB56-2]|uniref:Ubiquinol oxidase subunit 2 n=1 Tax=Sphingomonas brevis TaxID=2908206 RepID=A0ABT0S7U0_9SPHN|nr:ubiquinol oxidase subunit II [Sphingomonas brevis]MCL6740448.1 ubiquinol oxidase subunit II [Sphingomonas brevis]